MPNLFAVKGRIALITGGSSGIGFMIAKVNNERNSVSHIMLTITRPSSEMGLKYTSLPCRLMISMDQQLS